MFSSIRICTDAPPEDLYITLKGSLQRHQRFENNSTAVLKFTHVVEQLNTKNLHLNLLNDYHLTFYIYITDLLIKTGRDVGFILPHAVHYNTCIEI